MNVFDLEDEDFKEKLKKELKEFYIRNETEGMAKRTIWDASKAFIRGFAIQYKIRKLKEKNKKYKDLIAALKENKEKSKSRDSNHVIQKIKAIQHQINILLTEDMAVKLRYVRQFFFQISKQSGEMVILQAEERTIQKYNTPNGEEKHKKEDIQKIVTEFYSHLYRPTNTSQEEIEEYLD